MECPDCLHSPSFICQCANVYLCEVHIGKHLTQGHSYQSLVEDFNSIEKSMLVNKLKIWIDSLKKFKIKLTIMTNKTLKTIENSSILMINQINSMIKNYLNLIQKTKILKSEVKKIESIITSDLIINDLSFDNLHQQIKNTYSKNFHSIIIDPTKVMKNKMNKFLQTHNGGFYCLAISSDGRTLVTGSDDTSVRVWDMLTKTQISCFTQHKSIVRCIALSHESNFAVSGSFDKTLILWDMKNKCYKNIYKGHLSAVYTVSFSHDSSWIVSGSTGMEIMLWKTDSNECFRKIVASGQVWCGIISRKNFYYAGIGNSLEIWDLNSFKIILSMKAHDSCVKSLALTNKNKYLITGSSDKLVKIWEVDSTLLYATLSAHTQEVLSVSVTANDRYILSGSSDQSIIMWNINLKTISHKFTFHKSHIFGVIVFKDFIISASRDSTINITRISSKSLDFCLSNQPFEVGSEMIRNDLVAFGSLNNVIICDLKIKNSDIVLQGHVNIVQAVVISSNMNFLASSSLGNKKNLILWDLKKNSIFSVMNGHENSVFCVDISNDEEKMISGDFLGSIRLWDIQSFKEDFCFLGHSGQVYSVKFTKNKRFAASGGLDRNVMIWDVKDKSLYASLGGHQNIILKILGSDDGRYFVSGNIFDGVFVWNITLKRKIYAFKDQNEAKRWLEIHKDIEFEMSKYLI